MDDKSRWIRTSRNYPFPSSPQQFHLYFDPEQQRRIDSLMMMGNPVRVFFVSVFPGQFQENLLSHLLRYSDTSWSRGLDQTVEVFLFLTLKCGWSVACQMCVVMVEAIRLIYKDTWLDLFVLAVYYLETFRVFVYVWSRSWSSSDSEAMREM